MTVGQLLARYVELFGEQPRSRHKEKLVPQNANEGTRRVCLA